jgi:hypothetical protein
MPCPATAAVHAVPQLKMHPKLWPSYKGGFHRQHKQYDKGLLLCTRQKTMNPLTPLPPQPLAGKEERHADSPQPNS